MRLTVIIPAYNEENTVAPIIKKVLAAPTLGLTKEIIVVNDGSTDKTKTQIAKLKSQNIKIINKTQNEGKGAAIRSALKIATGDIFIIQDADLEYDSTEYPTLLAPILAGKAEIVYGSRFVGNQPHRVLYFWHYLGNKFITLLSNSLTNLNLTDIETGYKVFTKKVSQKLNLRENGFGFEPEFTMKMAQMGYPIYEVGVGYWGRTYAEGKKINWRDGLTTVWCLIKYRFI